MLENIKNYHVVLASKSPRRQELLKLLGVDFEVKVLPDVKENYPKELPGVEVPQYISREKAAAYELDDNELLLTADTVVHLDGRIFGKPHSASEASEMLHALSGHTHEVITGMTITTKQVQNTFAAVTRVTFAKLTDEEISYYIEHYKPFDKAGAYGIQEWIGCIGVESIDGSFYNVMGLPVQRLYTELKKVK